MTLILKITAPAVGFILDLIFGDPHGFPHIIRAVGGIIAGFEKLFRRLFPKSARGELAGGIFLVIFVTGVCFGISFYLLCWAYTLAPALGFVLECFLCYQLLAVRALRDESMKVYRALKDGDINLARKNLSMIVGRDTAELDNDSLTRGTIETIAENTSDGVIAPMLYIALGGAVGGLLYKAVNTMDSMVGYKNERYLFFGRAAARLDDFLGFIPSRLAALLMISSCPPLGLNGADARRIWRRDGRRHESPNSAQTEAACAGALGIRLAGPAAYFGVLKDKPYIGDAARDVGIDDIVSANRLLYATAVFMLVIMLALRGTVLYALYAAI